MSEHTAQFFLYDLTLLYLAFFPCSLGTCALIKKNTLRIFMFSGSIQFHSFDSVKSNHAIFLNNTFKSFWMIHVNTIHILISYSIIYGSLIIPNIHFHIQ